MIHMHSSFFVTIDYILYNFVGKPIFQLGSMLVTRKLSEATRYVKHLWRNVHLETDITIVIILLKLTLKLFAFNYTCKHYMNLHYLQPFWFIH